MNIAIIGGSGFIGTRFINGIKQKHTYCNLDKFSSEAYQENTSIVDIRNIEDIRSHLNDCDCVVHLAAEHRDNVTPISLYYDVNVEGTKNLLQVMREKNINHLIFTSTVALYGLDKENPDETVEPEPFNHYGKSKWLTELEIKKWYEESPSDRNVVIIRPTVVIGKGNRGNVYNLFASMMSGKFLMVGDGSSVKSMAYVENVSAFLKYCVEHIQKGYKIFNYVDTPHWRVSDLIQFAETKLEKKISKIRIPYFIGLCGGYVFDALSIVLQRTFTISSIRVKKFCSSTLFSSVTINGTGFVPPHTLQDGLEEMLEHDFLKK